jgi:hypothetical protein
MDVVYRWIKALKGGPSANRAGDLPLGSLLARPIHEQPMLQLQVLEVCLATAYEHHTTLIRMMHGKGVLSRTSPSSSSTSSSSGTGQHAQDRARLDELRQLLALLLDLIMRWEDRRKVVLAVLQAFRADLDALHQTAAAASTFRQF